MLVQVEFLKKYSDTDSAWLKEVYDVDNEWKAIDNVYDRHTRYKILKFKTKIIGSNARASSTNDGVQSQGAMFGDSSEA